MTFFLARCDIFSCQVCLYQQKERDSHTNLNRDLVLLVILVVMIQVCICCFFLLPDAFKMMAVFVYFGLGEIWIAKE